MATCIETAVKTNSDTRVKNEPIKIIYGHQTAIAQGNNILSCTPTVILIKEESKADNYLKKLAIATFNEDYIPGTLPPNHLVSQDNRIIQCYRAVQLFSYCTVTQSDTLKACYEIMDNTSEGIVARRNSINKLKRSYFRNVLSIRERLLSEKIPDEIVDRLVGVLIASRITPNVSELLAEINKGRINRTTQVDIILEGEPNHAKR